MKNFIVGVLAILSPPILVPIGIVVYACKFVQGLGEFLLEK